MNSPKNIKETLASIYFLEKEEYQGQLLQKMQTTHMKTINMKTFASRTIKTQFQDVLFERIMKMKKRSNYFNLHFLIDDEGLIKKNIEFVDFSKTSLPKARFNISFLLAGLYQREKIEVSSSSSHYFEDNRFFLNMKDLFFYFEDIFTLLEMYIINPFLFIEAICSFLFQQQSFYKKETFNFEILKLLFKDIMNTPIDKPIILSVKNSNYSLYREIEGNSSYEENVKKTIESFPDTDPIELLGLSPNDEINHYYRDSENIMKILKTFSTKEQKKKKMFAQTINLIQEADKDLSISKHLKNKNKKNMKNKLLVDNLLNLIGDQLMPPKILNFNSNLIFPKLQDNIIKDWFTNNTVEIVHIPKLEVVNFKRLNLNLKRKVTLTTSIRAFSKLAQRKESEVITRLPSNSFGFKIEKIMQSKNFEEKKFFPSRKLGTQVNQTIYFNYLY